MQEELYEGISGIRLIVDKACTTASCEAYVEGIGSKVNAHASKMRGTDLETYSREAFIAWNGPALPHADRFLSDALDVYYGEKEWHFNKTSKSGMTSSAQLGFTSKVTLSNQRGLRVHSVCR